MMAVLHSNGQLRTQRDDGKNLLYSRRLLMMMTADYGDDDDDDGLVYYSGVTLTSDLLDPQSQPYTGTSRSPNNVPPNLVAWVECFPFHARNGLHTNQLTATTTILCCSLWDLVIKPERTTLGSKTQRGTRLKKTTSAVQGLKLDRLNPLS